MNRGVCAVSRRKVARAKVTRTKRFGLGRLIRDYRVDVFLLVWIPHALLVWRFWFIVDDAFISFRYARNLVLGHGLRFNLGDHVPVEGYSNFLWVMISAVIQFLHLDITFWPAFLSAACGTVLLWLVFDLLRRRLELSLPVVVLGTLSLGCFPPFAVWSTGGLATMPFALLVFLTFERLVLRRAGADGIGGGVAALLLALIRIEGVGWAAVILILAVVSRRLAGKREIGPFVTFALIVGVGFAIYFAWRYDCYQALLPNTAYTKGSLDAGRLMRGVNYVVSHVLTFLAPVLIVPGTLVALRRKRITVGLPVAALAWGFSAYAVLVTGDWMPMGRFLIPGLAFGTVLLAWLLQGFCRRGPVGKKLAIVVGGAAIVLGLLPGWDEHLVPQSTRKRFAFRHFIAEDFDTEYERWRATIAFVNKYRTRGRKLRSYFAQRPSRFEKPSVVVGAIGAIGYYSELYIYDTLGLVTPEVGRGKVRDDVKVPSPAHDKCVPRQYFLKDQPAIWLDVRPRNKDPERVAGACLQIAELWQQSPRPRLLRERYGPDLARVAGDQTDAIDGAVSYVVVWARLPAGQTPEEAWAEFQARLLSLLSQGHLPPPPPYDGP